jgi:hypothetical protein
MLLSIVQIVSHVYVRVKMSKLVIRKPEDYINLRCGVRSLFRIRNVIIFLLLPTICERKNVQKESSNWHIHQSKYQGCKEKGGIYQFIPPLILHIFLKEVQVDFRLSKCI